MSMVDESPSTFIKEGKIYKHHEGSSYTAGGFTDYEPSWDSEVADATPRNINYYVSHGYVYNYDTHQKQEHIPSDYKDAFGNELFMGDTVYVVFTDYSDRFGGYMKCKIEGFTNMFAKLKIIEKSKYVYINTDKQILRMPHRLIFIK